MRKLSLFAVAFVLAAGAFWLTILASPPRSEASAGVQTEYAPYPVLLTKTRFIPEDLCGRFRECPRR